MDYATWVQILNEAISHSTNTFRKDSNLTIFPLFMGKLGPLMLAWLPLKKEAYSVFKSGIDMERDKLLQVIPAQEI